MYDCRYCRFVKTCPHATFKEDKPFKPHKWEHLLEYEYSLSDVVTSGVGWLQRFKSHKK